MKNTALSICLLRPYMGEQKEQLQKMLHKLYNQVEPDIKWISLNFQHQFLMRRGHFIVVKTNNIRVGENILVKRLNVLNNKISLDWLNLPYGAYKRKIKEMFLQ